MTSQEILISLPEGGAFPCSALIAHMKGVGVTFIVQGQKSISFDNHNKPGSLDYWLRANFAKNPDTKQAAQEVVDALVATGRFGFDLTLVCPDTGRRSKGLRLLD